MHLYRILQPCPLHRSAGRLSVPLMSGHLQIHCSGQITGGLAASSISRVIFVITSSSLFIGSYTSGVDPRKPQGVLINLAVKNTISHKRRFIGDRLVEFLIAYLDPVFSCSKQAAPCCLSESRGPYLSVSVFSASLHRIFPCRGLCKT